MNFKLVFFIALRYLRTRHKSSFISVTSSFAMLGIILGVATLIVVMSVMNGYREELIKITLGVGGHITVKGGSVGISNYQALATDIMKNNEVNKVIPLIEDQVMIVTPSKSSGGLVRGIEVSNLSRKLAISSNITSGSFKSFSGDPDSVIIGESLAQNLGIQVNDEIKIITSSVNRTIMGSVPRYKTFKVAAIFNSGSYLYDSVLVFMHLETAQKLFSLSDRVNQLELSISDPFKSDIMANKIADFIKRKYYVEDWQHQNAQILSALEIERAVMFLILTLIIIVAAFNIVSSLYMLVNDKKYDIAILRTIGASKLMIISVFIIMGLILGIFGSTFGILLGLGFAENIEKIRRFLESITSTTLFDPVVYYLNILPAKVDYKDVYNISILTILLSIAATIFPALKASQVNPGEALRNE